MPRGLGDLAASLDKMPAALNRGQWAGVRKAAELVERTVKAEIRSATGDMRLSGVGRSGAKVGSKVEDYRKAVAAGEAAKVVLATGPLHLIERSTSPHPIYPKGLTFSTTRRGNIRRRGKTKALKFGGRYSMWSDHPGTPAKRPFAKGVAIASPRTTGIFQAEVRKAIAQGWGF